MIDWIRALDRILRGEATRLSALEQGKVDVPLFGLCVVIVALGVMYGAFMGTFALFRADGPVYEQLLASMVKVPALFFLTLLVTFPSLYVFNALVGSRLGVTAVLRLLIASLGVNLAVLWSLGFIVAFFSVSTTSYLFMVLLNVVVYSVAGILGLSFLLQTLHRLTVAEQRAERQPKPALPPDATAAGEQLEAIVAEAVEEPGALDRLDQPAISAPVKAVFRCWVVVFGLVGADGLGAAAVHRKSLSTLRMAATTGFEFLAGRMEFDRGAVFLNGLRVAGSEF